jgi:RNA polymerase sigma-70 factor (ECF subfamily)
MRRGRGHRLGVRHHLALEVAEHLGLAPPRHLAHLGLVEARRPRERVTPSQRDAVIERFLAATATGDIEGLLDVLAPNVVLVTDGGGFKKAALRPIRGRDKVLRFLAAVAPEDGEAQVVMVNGQPALRLLIGGEVDAIGTMLVEGGLVTGLYLVRNPEKLARIDQAVPLTR